MPKLTVWPLPFSMMVSSRSSTRWTATRRAIVASSNSPGCSVDIGRAAAAPNSSPYRYFEWVAEGIRIGRVAGVCQCPAQLVARLLVLVQALRQDAVLDKHP